MLLAVVLALGVKSAVEDSPSKRRKTSKVARAEE